MGLGQSSAGLALDVVSITRRELLEMVETLNRRCQLCFAESRVKMLFAVRELDDKSVMWKKTVRINCYTVRDERSYCKIYSLYDFFKFCRSLNQILDAAAAITAPSSSAVDVQSTSDLSANDALMKMSIFQESCNIDGLCIICFDAKPNVVLPCTHAYCDKCVGAFKAANQNSCPLCRHRLIGAGRDCYVVVEKPDKEALCTYMVAGAGGQDLAALKCGD